MTIASNHPCRRAAGLFSRRQWLARTTAVSGLLVAGGLPAAQPMAKQAGASTALPGRPARPRIVLNDDGFNFLASWDDLGPDDLRAYLVPDMLRKGENRLSVSRRQGDPDLSGPIQLVELELFLHY